VRDGISDEGCIHIPGGGVGVMERGGLLQTKGGLRLLLYVPKVGDTLNSPSTRLEEKKEKGFLVRRQLKSGFTCRKAVGERLERSGPTLHLYKFTAPGGFLREKRGRLASPKKPLL